MNVLCQLQQWYALHCDGDWEHCYGIRLETLDNPGWHLTVDLHETLLEYVPFSGISWGDSENAKEPWLHCRKDGPQFVGMCSTLELEKMISAFLEWAQDNTDTSPWDGAVQALLAAISAAQTQEEMRKVYPQIDEIPNEHPRKREVYEAFQRKWDAAIMNSCAAR